MQELSQVIASFPGILISTEQEEGEWWRITFDVKQTPEGWRSLEFLAWAVSDMKRSEYRITLQAASSPPYLNTPGQSLYFLIEATDNAEHSAVRAAKLLAEWQSYYIAVGDEDDK